MLKYYRPSCAAHVTWWLEIGMWIPFVSHRVFCSSNGSNPLKSDNSSNSPFSFSNRLVGAYFSLPPYLISAFLVTAIGSEPSFISPSSFILSLSLCLCFSSFLHLRRESPFSSLFLYLCLRLLIENNDKPKMMVYIYIYF